jgi:hypothetical protein
MEKYIITAKCVFSKYIDVQIVEADSNDSALQMWKSLNGQLGINVATRYIEDSIKVQRAGLTDSIFFRDIRMANSSMTSNHNFGLSTDDKCDNLKDKHVLSMEEAKRHLSNEEYRDLFTKVDDMFYDSNNPPF